MDTYSAPQSPSADPGLALLTRSVAEPEVLLSWEAAEYVHYEKSRTWYLLAGLVTVLMIGYSIITEAYITAIAVALLAGVVYLYSHELPASHRIIVNRLGVVVGEKFYPFASISSFWLVITPDAHQLYLETAGRTGQIVTVQLGEMDPVLVRRTLSNEIPEAQGRDEGFIDRLARVLKL